MRQSTALSENRESVAAIVRSYLESFERGVPDEIAALVSEDFINEHTSALGSGSEGRGAYLDRLPAFLRDMSGLCYDIERLVVDGQEAAAFYTMTARWQGETPISVRGVMRVQVNGTLIAHRTDYWDSAVFLTQVSEDARHALRPFGIS